MKTEPLGATSTHQEASRGATIAYWVSTALFGVMMAMSGVMYLTQPAMAEAFGHLGFPPYFRVELGIAKLLGAIALLAPAVPARVREWAYAGFAITLLSAVVAHATVDGPAEVVPPLVAGLLLAVSYATRSRAAVSREALAVPGSGVAA